MNPATLVKPGQAEAAEAQVVVQPVPFTRASFEHEEPFLDKTFVPGASSVQVGPEPVTSYGYMASIFLVVETVGTAGAATFRPDAPWSILQDVTLLDINGAPIVGPISGYDLYLINKWGGYEFMSDPTQMPEFTQSTANGSIRFAVRIPVQLSRRDALGCLPNMNSAATYQVRASVAPLNQVYATGPSTPPTGVRITAHLEAWSQPAATDRSGAPNASQPPALGTTSFWSKNTTPILLGHNVSKMVRMGNLLRNVIFIARTAAGARDDAMLPTDLRWMFDGQEILNRSAVKWRRAMRERGGQALDVGVYVLDFTHDFTGGLGGEMRDLWFPTEQSSKSELIGSWTAAGSLDVLTNDVAVTTSPFVR